MSRPSLPDISTKRLYDGDPVELRSSYLFHFANILHISPVELDQMKYRDFAELVLSIDAYNEARQKQQEAQ